MYFVLLFCVACVFELMTLPANLNEQSVVWTPCWLLLLFWVNALKNPNDGAVYLAWGLGLLVDALLDQVLGVNALIFSLTVLIGQGISSRWILYSKTQTTILIFFGVCLMDTTRHLYLEMFDKAAWDKTSLMRAFTTALMWILYEFLRQKTFFHKLRRGL